MVSKLLKIFFAASLSLPLVLGVYAFPKYLGVSNASAQEPDYNVGNSILQRLRAEFRSRPSFRNFTPGDRLGEYAEQCRIATGIKLPDSINCLDGVEVPGQGTQPGGTACDHPNVLYGVCDPGSRFQVLAGRSADAVAVAHCRPHGQAADSGKYSDIAIIQYNKANGAVCYYQALDTGMPGNNIPSPALGQTAKWADGTPHWSSPAETYGMGCTGCHDNGGFIRSNYIAQLRTLPNAMPNQADGYSNAISPLRYVGQEFAGDHSWSIETANAPNDPGPSCTACHRLAVNDHAGGGFGTAMVFGLTATRATQDSKNPHGPNSPIWMRPGQIFYEAGAEATAQRFHDCAEGFKQSGFKTAPPGCVIRPLGVAWAPPTLPTSPAASVAPLVEYLLNP